MGTQRDGIKYVGLVLALLLMVAGIGVTLFWPGQRGQAPAPSRLPDVPVTGDSDARKPTSAVTVKPPPEPPADTDAPATPSPPASPTTAAPEASADSPAMPPAATDAPSRPGIQWMSFIPFLRRESRLTQREFDRLGVTDQSEFGRALFEWEPNLAYLDEARQDAGVAGDLAFAFPSPYASSADWTNRVRYPLREAWWAHPALTAVWETPRNDLRDEPLWLTWGVIRDEAGERVTETFGRHGVYLNDQTPTTAWQLVLPQDAETIRHSRAIFATLSRLGPDGVIDPPLCAGRCAIIGTSADDPRQPTTVSLWPTWLSVPAVHVDDTRLLPGQFFEAATANPVVTLRFRVGDPHIDRLRLRVTPSEPNTVNEDITLTFDPETLRDATPWQPITVDFALPVHPRVAYTVRLEEPSRDPHTQPVLLGQYAFNVRLPSDDD